MLEKKINKDYIIHEECLLWNWYDTEKFNEKSIILKYKISTRYGGTYGDILEIRSAADFTYRIKIEIRTAAEFT